MNLKTKVLYLVSLAAFLRSFAQVIYVPSEVTMRGELNTTTAMIGLTLSVYGLFLAFSQIAYGPIVDRFDSKRVLLVGTIVFVAGSLGGYFAGDIGLLLLARSLQALGIAAAAAVGVALIADVFPAAERGRAMGIFSMFNSGGAAAAPAAGAAIAVGFGWRADFLALALVGLGVAIFTLWKLPAQPVRGQKVGLPQMLTIARTPATFGAIALGLVQFYGLYTIHTLMPLLLTDRLGQAEAGIGTVAAFLPIGVIAGSLLGGHTSDRRGLRFTLMLSAIGATLTFGALAILSVVAQLATPLPVVVVMVAAYGFTAGIGFPAQLNIMVDWFPAYRGTAGALQFFARFIGTTIAPTLGGYLADSFGLPYGFGVATALLGVGAAAAFFTIADPRPVPAPIADYSPREV